MFLRVLCDQVSNSKLQYRPVEQSSAAVAKATMPKYVSWEMYIVSTWLMSVMSLKDFKLDFIVIEEFKFLQGSLQNLELQFSCRFYFISFQMSIFLVIIAYFNGHG